MIRTEYVSKKTNDKDLLIYNTKNIQAKWQRKNPKTIKLQRRDFQRRVSYSEVKLRPKELKKIPLKPEFQAEFGDLNFYSPSFKVKTSNFSSKPKVESSPFSADVSIWAPCDPTKPKSIPEPRIMMFNGEHGSFRILLHNKTNQVISIKKPRVMVPRNFSTDKNNKIYALEPMSSKEIIIPFSISSRNLQNFANIRILIEGRTSSKKYQLKKDITLLIHKYEGFKINIKKNRRHPNIISFDATVGSSPSAGFFEKVRIKAEISFRIKKNVLHAKFQINEFEAEVNFSKRVSSTMFSTMRTPIILAVGSFWGDMVKNIAHALFVGATGGLSALIGAIGAAAAKGAIAFALNLLSPFVSVPAILILYSPAFETWWVGFCAGVAGLYGGAVNETIWQHLTS